MRIKGEVARVGPFHLTAVTCVVLPPQKDLRDTRGRSTVIGS